MAKDQGGLSASALIAVNVIDVNDNEPVFLPTDYSAKLSWNTETDSWDHGLSSPILSVRATDADDKGPNSDITYEIVDGNDKGLFSLNPKSGKLQLTGRLVYSIFLLFNLIYYFSLGSFCLKCRHLILFQVPYARTSEITG